MKRLALFFTPLLLMACTTAPEPAQIADMVIEPKSKITFVNNTATTQTSANGDEIICREYKKTGSRIGTVKACHTKAEWDAIDSETQRNIQDMYLKNLSDHG